MRGVENPCLMAGGRKGGGADEWLCVCVCVYILGGYGADRWLGIRRER